MKKTLIFIFIATLFCSLVCNKIEAKTNSSNNIKISNKYFSVYLNNNVKGDGISINFSQLFDNKKIY